MTSEFRTLADQDAVGEVRIVHLFPDLFQLKFKMPYTYKYSTV